MSINDNEGCPNCNSDNFIQLDLFLCKSCGMVWSWVDPKEIKKIKPNTLLKDIIKSD